MDEKPRAVGALDLSLRGKIDIDPGMATYATAARARDYIGFDVDDFERLHRVHFTFAEEHERPRAPLTPSARG